MPDDILGIWLFCQEQQQGFPSGNLVHFTNITNQLINLHRVESSIIPLLQMVKLRQRGQVCSQGHTVKLVLVQGQNPNLKTLGLVLYPQDCASSLIFNYSVHQKDTNSNSSVGAPWHCNDSFGMAVFLVVRRDDSGLELLVSIPSFTTDSVCNLGKSRNIND